MASTKHTFTVATGTADTSALRTETFRGKEYTVVPVIAVVEGVLQGVNSEFPELAVASEFGKHPASWDGRPVMMNHPSINGVFVSASIHSVLEDFQMGFLANTRLDDKKLKTEAWIDNEAIAALSGEPKQTMDRILLGEVVDVSVGAFMDIVEQAGTYGGNAYQGIWSNVVPDHLAFLSANVQGACTVEAGCGAPRVNSSADGKSTVVLRMVKPLSGACCDACAKSGGTCGGHHSGTTGDDIMPKANAADGQTSGEAPVVASSQEPTGETTETSTTAEPAGVGAATTEAQGELPLEGDAAEALRIERAAHLFSALGAFAAPSGMIFSDIEKVVNQALSLQLGVNYYDVYIQAINQDVVVYYAYGGSCGCGSTCGSCYGGSRYATFQVGYSIDDNGNVTFTGEPEPVNILTRIVPRQTSSSGVSVNQERNTEMSGNSGTSGEGAAETPAAPAQVKSFAELLESAPAEIREQFERGNRIYSSTKAKVVKALMESSRNKFTEEQLNSKPLDELEMLAELADVNPAPFAGRAVGEGDNLSVNAQSNKPAFAESPRSYLGQAAS